MDFYDKFKNFSNEHLLEIIENPNDYQPKAVQTATAVIQSRNLSQEEIEAANQENELKRSELENEKRRKKEQIQLIRNKLSVLINNFRPYSDSELSPNKINKYLVVVLIVYVLFQLYQIGALFINMFQYNLLDYISVLFVLPTLYLCVCIFLLFRQNKYGWHLLSFFGIYHIIFCLYSYLKFSGIYSGFFQISQGDLFSAFFLWCCIIYTLNTKSIVELYQLSKENRLTSVSISLIFNCLIILVIFK